MKAFFNWSGGKDSSLALYHLQQKKTFQIDYLLTSVNSQYNRISMHGVRTELLEQQAYHIGIPLKKLLLPESPSMDDYNTLMQTQMDFFKSEGLEYAIFGDIFLEDLKQYRINQLAKAGLKAEFPLWGRNTKELITEFIDLGFKTITVCVDNRYLSQDFVGQVIDANFIKELPKNVDPCGENGEFHTFVFDGPIFKNPVKFEKGDIVHRLYPAPKANDCHKQELQDTSIGFDFCDLLPLELSQEIHL